MAGERRARREALGDPVAESGVRQSRGRDAAHGRDRHERGKRPRVVARASDVDRRGVAIRWERHDRDVDVARGVDLRNDECRRRANFGRRSDRDRAVEGLAAIAGDRHLHLHALAIRGAVEDGPRRVDVVLERVPDNVIHRDPLLVLDVAGLLRRSVVRGLERPATVALHPRPAHVVAEGDVDLAVRVQLGRVEKGVERQHRLIDPALRVEVEVGIGRVGPARRHRLRPGAEALVPLDLVVSRGRAVRHLVRAEVEHVEGAVFVKEELRRADQVFSARFHRDP